jgi:hypothetical protein
MRVLGVGRYERSTNLSGVIVMQRAEEQWSVIDCESSL